MNNLFKSDRFYNYLLPCQNLQVTLPQTFRKVAPQSQILTEEKPIALPLPDIDFTTQNTRESFVDKAEILFITSYPPRECGIASFSRDLIKAISNQFSSSYALKVCALESNSDIFIYPDEVKYRLNTSYKESFKDVSAKINADNGIKVVIIQHEFGFFKDQEDAFIEFVYELTKPVIMVFHTVLSHPNNSLKLKIQSFATICKSFVVMTKNSKKILVEDYGVSDSNITIIAHGTHLVSHLSKTFLKNKYGLKGRKVLSTFGLLSSGKSIETTIDALPEIVRLFPDVVFLILGKTHPEVIKHDGEAYRESLEQKVANYNLQNNVIFINEYLPLPVLLEYLQMTDVYLFTTNDPNQAVSGTFVYAMSCACPIISTPIPHAKELLSDDSGIIFDFGNSEQLSKHVISLLKNKNYRKSISTNVLQKIVSTAWENAAIAHVVLFKSIEGENIPLYYNWPRISLNHINQMTTSTGIIQFAKINQPDMSSGYTLDDNARALIALCMHFDFFGDEEDLIEIYKYLNFIEYCLKPDGSFNNYTDKDNHFTPQNDSENLDDANGRALWALGYVVSLSHLLPAGLIMKAKTIFDKSIPHITTIRSTRAMAFAIKGLFYFYNVTKNTKSLSLLDKMADRLLQMYKHETSADWKWFESYLTYANSILPEAMLYAWLLTKKPEYIETAIQSFNFLLSQTFNENGIEVISNKKWLKKGQKQERYGEQPIDVAYTIMTLSRFYEVFQTDDYKSKMEIAFEWFLGRNRLRQIVYNPCTGGCYDGLEETHVNLNQGAESSLSYLMARLTIGRY